MKTDDSQPRNGRLFAAWYPALMGRIERNGQATIRHDQLAAVTGRVLEIGAGSGLSVPHYPAGLTELVLLEPNPAFRVRLRELLDRTPSRQRSSTAMCMTCLSLIRVSTP